MRELFDQWDKCCVLLQEQEDPNQLFLYYGPEDERNRSFCASLVGKVVTIRMLQQMTNKDGNNPSEWLGGYGCRHKLIKVSNNDIMKMNLPVATKRDYITAQGNAELPFPTVSRPSADDRTQVDKDIYDQPLKAPDRDRYRSRSRRKVNRDIGGY